jgi:hypothetical protein
MQYYEEERSKQCYTDETIRGESVDNQEKGMTERHNLFHQSYQFGKTYQSNEDFKYGPEERCMRKQIWKTIARWKNMTRADKDGEINQKTRRSMLNTMKRTNILGWKKSLPTSEENRMQDRKLCKAKLYHSK